MHANTGYRPLISTGLELGQPKSLISELRLSFSSTLTLKQNSQMRPLTRRFIRKASGGYIAFSFIILASLKMVENGRPP
jgi:hypothetical protein